MVKKFDDATLSTARTLPLSEVLNRLGSSGFYWRRDRDFRPVKDSRTERLYVSKEGGEAWEILTTWPKWYDARAEKGGGGGIDFVMHLTGLDFVSAVRLLSHTTS